MSRLIVCLWMALVLASTESWAHRQAFKIIGNSAAYDQLSSALQASMHDGSRANGAKAILSDQQLVITMGYDGLLEALRDEPDAPIIATFISSSDFYAVVALLDSNRAAHVGAVFSDPSPIAQLALARQILGRGARIGFLSSAPTAVIERQLGRPTILGGQRYIQRLSSAKGIGAALNRIGGIDGLLAMPDEVIYNRATIRSLINSLYRQRASLIGYSANMVKVGAIASVYSTREQLIQQVVEQARQWQATSRLPLISHPLYFDVAVNKHLTNSLGFEVPSDAALRNAIDNALGRVLP